MHSMWWKHMAMHFPIMLKLLMKMKRRRNRNRYPLPETMCNMRNSKMPKPEKGFYFSTLLNSISNYAYLLAKLWSPSWAGFLFDCPLLHLLRMQTKTLKCSFCLPTSVNSFWLEPWLLHALSKLEFDDWLKRYMAKILHYHVAHILTYSWHCLSNLMCDAKDHKNKRD